MKIEYVSRNFSLAALDMIAKANAIIEEYQEQGIELTLRQLYYQHVARGLIPNNQREYKRLGSIINDARLAGMISWKAIVDRTRNLQGNSHWNSPKEIVETAAKTYQIDKWEDQEFRVEVWVEKDALVGIVEDVCRDLDVSFFSCRGYTSQSEMWAAGMRLKRFAEPRQYRKPNGHGAYTKGQKPVIIHLGDHDPSGIDMSRDIDDRLRLFGGASEIQVNRIALNMDQIERYSPPPNPAKITDSRAAGYISIHGNESWELDALEPRVLSSLIRKTVLKYRDEDLWHKREFLEQKHKRALLKAAKGFK